MSPQKGRNDEAPKIQRKLQEKRNLSGLIVMFVLFGIVGYFFYENFITIKGLREENATMQNQLSQFIDTDPITVYKDKTFVRYDQNPLAITVYSSKSCGLCESEIQEIISKLQTSLPTLQDITILDTDDKQVQEEALKLGVGYLPGFIFSQDIEQTEFYIEGKEFFSEKSDGSHQFYTHSLGHEPIEYIATTNNLTGFPSQDVVTTRQSNASTKPVEIHAFLTTDCPACKTARDVVKSIEKVNPNVKVVEHFSENLQKKDISATKAIACAHQDGKGEVFTDTLFSRQAAWLTVANLDPIFKQYATNVGIPASTFESCLQEDNAELVRQDRLFQTFGITQVPTIFIDNNLFVGVQTVSTLNEAIAQSIAK